ncbi:MAG: oligoendopeptidase F [Calditrichaeota bacterium]|nr:oligoendopeptidase F [Candidatus Cloacimonadota bacterium]MCB1046095.1 oligoendopeptidase F [Calditrichota bacterium]
MSSTSAPARTPERKEVKTEHCWNLTELYKDDSQWEADLKKLAALKPRIAGFKGTLGKSAEALKACLEFTREMELLQETLYVYAHLKVAEDGINSENQARQARIFQLLSEMGAEFSWYEPELHAIDSKTMDAFLASGTLDEFRIQLNKSLRYKPHVLSEREERLLAMQSEFASTAYRGFSALTDMDLEFGECMSSDGMRPLTQSTMSLFMLDPDREVRRNAYFQYHGVWQKHKNTLAALFNGSVQHDIFSARIRNFPSAREASLFSEDVPVSVYDNLVSTVRANLNTLHRYYTLRSKMMGLQDMASYDLRVPLIKDIKVNHSYEQAVEVIDKALQPLGAEYCGILRKGLLEGWVDRYENKGKTSGAFSSGGYIGSPFILMNYKDEAIDDVFTLAHEGGHSMHSYYSKTNNPFQHYGYTIFVAEVASTFNEQLLARHLYEEATDDTFRAYLINKQIDDIIGTIFRQTMFAEFERDTHAMVEQGQPLTVESLCALYQELSRAYYGSPVTLPDENALIGLMIPHFYHAFYVYKYATGLSAAITLSQGVLEGGGDELQRYLGFLKLGGSKFPLDQLRDAGVDMTQAAPVQKAMDRFSDLVGQLEAIHARSQN